MKLYEITGAMKEVQKLLDEGVPADQLQDTIDEIEGDFKDKAQNCLIAHANLEAESDALKAEIARLTARKKTKDSQAESLKNYILFNMEKLNIKDVDAGVRSAKLRKAPATVQVNDESKLSMDYKSIKTSIAVDKNALLKDLKALAEGEVIEGAELVEGKHTLTIK